MPTGDSFVVAGQFVELTIVGSGVDWDLKSQEPQTEGGSGGVPEPDLVTFTWSGAPCIVSADGKSASCQIGSAGSGSIVNVYVDADDAAVVPAGDDGSRDDPAERVSTQVYGIWVTISGNFDGPFDTPDNQLSFDSVPFYTVDSANPTSAGPTTPGPTSSGYFAKTELIGTIGVPNHAADGKAGFDWVQNARGTACGQLLDGTTWTTDQTSTNTDHPDGWFLDGPFPEGALKQTLPIHSKIYLIDPPGLKTPNNNYKINQYKRLYLYQEFQTHVEFNGTLASNIYPWHVVIKLAVTTGSSGTAVWQEEARDVGLGATNFPPSDCTVQP